MPNWGKWNGPPEAAAAQVKEDWAEFGGGESQDKNGAITGCTHNSLFMRERERDV